MNCVDECWRGVKGARVGGSEMGNGLCACLLFLFQFRQFLMREFKVEGETRREGSRYFRSLRESPCRV